MQRCVQSKGSYPPGSHHSAEDPTYRQGTAVSDVRGKGTGADSFLVLVFQSHVSDLKCGFPLSMKIKSEGIL